MNQSFHKIGKNILNRIKFYIINIKKNALWNYTISSRLKEAQDKASARTKDLISLTDDLHAKELSWYSERDQLKNNMQLLQEQVGDQHSSIRGYSVLGGVRPKKPKEVDTQGRCHFCE